jgi:hypothetical protein
MELPADFTISESINGVVSLVKDRPSLIQPEEVAALESALQQHPEARHYWVAVKHDRIEIYEQVGPDYEALLGELHMVGLSRPDLAERLQAEEERPGERRCNSWKMSPLLHSGLATNQDRICSHSPSKGSLWVRRQPKTRFLLSCSRADERRCGLGGETSSELEEKRGLKRTKEDFP